MKILSYKYAALLTFGGICILLLTCIVPLWSTRAALEKRLPMLKTQTEAVLEQSARLIQLNNDYGGVEARQAASLFAEVESVANRLGILDKVISLKPSTLEGQGLAYERINISLGGLSQQKGISLLHALEKEGRAIQVEQFTLRRSAEKFWELALTLRRSS